MHCLLLLLLLYRRTFLLYYGYTHSDTPQKTNNQILIFTLLFQVVPIRLAGYRNRPSVVCFLIFISFAKDVMPVPHIHYLFVNPYLFRTSVICVNYFTFNSLCYP